MHRNFIVFAFIPLILSIGIILIMPIADAIKGAQQKINSHPSETECRTGQILVYHLNHNQYICTSYDAAERWQQLGFVKIVDPPDITKTCLGGHVSMKNINTGSVTCVDKYRVTVLEKRGWVEVSKLEQNEVASDRRFEDAGKCEIGFVALENPHNGLVFCSEQSSVEHFLSIGWVTLDDIPTSVKEYRFPDQSLCRTAETELKNWGSGHVICAHPKDVDTLLSEGWELFRPPPLSDYDFAFITLERIGAETTVDPRFEMEEECPGGNVFLENPSNGFIHCANIFSVPKLLLQGWITLDNVPTSETDYHFPHLTKCEEGEAELKHSSSGDVICISQDKVDSLISEGWEPFTPPELSDLEIQSLLNIEEEIQDAPYTTNLEIFETDEQDVYQVIFQECAEDTTIRDPVISITSDTQQQEIQLIDTLHRNDCVWAVTQIRALDPTSIKVQAVEFGDDESISSLEQKIEELEQKVEKESQELVRVKNMNYNHHQEYIDAVKEQSDKLQSVRRELKSITSEYYTYMYRLHR